MILNCIDGYIMKNTIYIIYYSMYWVYPIDKGVCI